MLQSSDTAERILKEGRSLYGPGWKVVDSFEDLEDGDEYESEEEEEYVVLDLGDAVDGLSLQAETAYQLIGMDTPLPFLKLNDQIFQGEMTPLIGDEVILGLIRNQENPHNPTHPPIHKTRNRMTFRPITLQSKQDQNGVKLEPGMRNPKAGSSTVKGVPKAIGRPKRLRVIVNDLVELQNLSVDDLASNVRVVFTDSAIPLILASPHLHPGTTLDPNKDYTRTEIIKLKEGRPLVGRGSRGATSRVTGSRRRDGHGELKGEGVRIQKKKKGEPEIMGGWTGPVLTVGGIPRKRPGKVVSRVGGGGLAIGAVGVPVRSREGVGEASAGVSQRVEDDEEEEEKEDDGPGSENDDDEMEVDEDVDEDEDEEMDEERGSEDPGDGDEDTGS